MQKETRRYFIAGFLALGILFLFFAFYLGKSENPFSRSQLAKVSRFTGQVDLMNYGMTKRQKVEKTESVQNLDSIQTDDIGEAHLFLETGQEVRILPSSFVTIEKIENKPDQLQILLLIKAGDISIKKLGREDSLFIGKNGKRIASENYTESELSQAPVQTHALESTDASHSQGLSEEEITSTLSQHRTQFFKCFTRLLQQNPKIRGGASLTFTIENNGHPSSLDVATDFGDESFKSCLLEVMNRIEFKPFQGSPISTVFPLKFEP